MIFVKFVCVRLKYEVWIFKLLLEEVEEIGNVSIFWAFFVNNVI